MSSKPAHDRIAIIGAGHVGSTTAYALMLRALFREIVLIDEDDALAKAEAADLLDANAMARPVHIRAGSYADAAGAGIAVITAGAATHGSQSRLSVAAASAVIMRDCVGRLVEAGFDGIILVAANPVDLMTLVALRASGFAPSRVIGSGTLLDTSRFRQALAQRLSVAPGSIDGFVIGEHGDTEVAAFSTVRIGGMTLEAFCAESKLELDRAALAVDVRDAGYRIVHGKGYTSFGIATALVRICEAIVRDEQAVLAVSTLLTGQYGIDGLCLSLPCILGANGIGRVLSPAVDAAEGEGLVASASVLRKAWMSIAPAD
jgi:L-lactate dehydrogenase